MTNATQTLTPPPAEPARPLAVDPALFLRLAAPFERGEVKCKPAAVKGNRALALHYIDARCVMERLDDEVGPANWRDEYVTLANASVECRLSLRMGGEWITKADVGGQSEQPDEGDKTKAAYSDALKRAAVKWGIGRYLYRLPQSWAEFDPQAKRFARPPELPAWALPAPQFVSDAQAKELHELIAESGVPVAKFCEHYGIKAVGELPPAKYLEACGKLFKAIRVKAAQEKGKVS